MNDIQTKEDIIKLVNSFYKKVQQDAVIGFFFNNIAKVNWQEHLPRMYEFWETILLNQASYKGNPMQKHFPVNAIQAIEKSHFDHWIKLWTQTIEENFSGATAHQAISKATNIAYLMGFKMERAL